MAASLQPAVSGATPRSLRRVTTLHGAGLLAGAIVMSLTLTLAGSLVIAAGLRIILLVPVGAALALAVLQSAGLRIPQSRWQVPDYWRRTLDAGTLPVAYGAILGVGVFTAVVVGAFWVFVAVTLLCTTPVALIGWSAYAAGRMIGFRLALQMQQMQRPLERIFLTAFQRRALIIATTMLAALVAFA
jgi:hypothetical protein